MAKTLVVHGHGKWMINKAEYTQTPAKVSIEFYTEGGKNQLTGFVYEYLLGSGLDYTGGKADQVIGPFKSTPDYTISALSQKQYASATKYLAMGTLVDNPNFKVLIMKPGSTPKKLSLLLKFAEKHNFTKVVWMACRAVDLNKTGGRELGFNTAQQNRKVSKAILEQHMLEVEFNKLDV